MGIFDKKQLTSIPAQAPEELETQQEQDYIKEKEDMEQLKTIKQYQQASVPEIREIPVCMSQTQINNMIIGLDIKLNYIISKIDE